MEVEGHIRCVHTAPLLTLSIRDWAKDTAITFENVSTEASTSLSGLVMDVEHYCTIPRMPGLAYWLNSSVD